MKETEPHTLDERRRIVVNQWLFPSLFLFTELGLIGCGTLKGVGSLDGAKTLRFLQIDACLETQTTGNRWSQLLAM